MFVTEAYGGRGGIAQFNRNWCEALGQLPECAEVVVLARVAPQSKERMPAAVTLRADAAGSKMRYVGKVLTLLARDRGFDLVICGHVHLAPLASVAKRLCDSPMLLVLHGIEAWKPPRSRWVRRSLLRAGSFVAVSGVTRDRFRGWANVPEHLCEVVPNVFERSSFSPGDKPPEFVERYGLQGKRVILTVARLAASERYKGIDEVLEALPILLNEDPDLVYIIAGDGDDRHRLAHKAEDLGVGAHVRFTGWIAESEKADHYRLADAFVMPGRGEGFGIVYLEALACGTPVVGSKLDGSRDALRAGNLGVLVNPDDQAELVAGIQNALSRPKVVPPALDEFEFHTLVPRLRAVLSRLSVVSPAADTITETMS